MKTELFSSPPMNNLSQRLKQQIQFILELDKLKHIMRRTTLLDKSRPENDAEHSWHLAMIAVILAEYAGPEVNINRVIKMLLIHDLVEIDAGDTFLYDDVAINTKADREHAAAQRLYAILPHDLGEELKSLWQEFEERKSQDAKFAAGLDRLQPLLHNYFTNGGAWSHPEVTATKVISKQRIIAEASQPLWEFAESLITDAIAQGFLRADVKKTV